MRDRDKAPGGWCEHATPEDVCYAHRLLPRRPPDPGGFDHYRLLRFDLVVERGRPRSNP